MDSKLKFSISVKFTKVDHCSGSMWENIGNTHWSI